MNLGGFNVADLETAFGEIGLEVLERRKLFAGYLRDGSEGARLHAPPATLRLNGTPVTQAVAVPRAELEQGVVQELADRIALLLYLFWPPAPRASALGMIGGSEATLRFGNGFLTGLLAIANLTACSLLDHAGAGSSPIRTRPRSGASWMPR